MNKSSTLLLLAVLTFSLSTLAAPPSDESINQLLQLTKVDKLVDSVITQMDGMMKSAMQQATKGKTLSAEEQAIMDRQQAKMISIMKEELSWDRMKDLYVQVYRETFSQEEIDGLIAFYRTPVGQSFVNKQPELMKRTMTIMQQRMTPMLQKIQKMAEETASEMQKAKPANASAPKTD